MHAGALRGRQRDGLAVARASHGPCHRARHAHQVGLRQAVHVPVVGRLALDHANADARLATALGGLHAALVQREREALPVLGVELGQVAPVCEGAAEHPPGELGVHEAHGSYPSTMRTMLSETSSALS